MSPDKSVQPAFLPYGRQTLDDDDVAAVVEALKSDYLTTGPRVAAFEAAVATASDAAHAAACSSGTAALHLSALALRIGPGASVIVPAVTFAATANVVRHVGAEVVFADVDPDTGLMTPETLSAALEAGGDAVCAVYPVHLAGQCADMAALGALARARGLAVVEDAAHALGAADIAGAPVGACPHSDVAIFSFHPVKTATTGEGGAVTTQDDELDRRVRLLRNHGMERAPDAFLSRNLGFASDGSPNPWYYEIAELGFNYRLTDIQCALGLSQLSKLERFVAHRAALVARYRTALAPLAPVVRAMPQVPGCRPAWHLFVALIDFAAAGVDRATVMRRLAERGIGSQVHYMPLHLHPYYRERYGALSLPGAEGYYARALSLPLFPAMADADVDRVVGALAAVVGGQR